MLFFGFQAPETLMGTAAPTGLGSNLASEHGSSFERHIQSIQEEIEKLIEEKIFRRILLSHGFDDHVEIIWGEPNEEAKIARIQMLQGLMSFVSSNTLRFEIEKDIARNLGYDEDIITQGEEEREKEEKNPQPFVPGFLKYFKNKIWKGKSNRKHYNESFELNEEFYKDYPLIEWIGFNYRKFVRHIDNVIENDNFESLRANNAQEDAMGYLNDFQIAKLKSGLRETFNKGLSIRTLASTLIGNNVIPALKNEIGDIIINSATRSIMVARTETIRVSALGALENYKENNIAKVRFTAAISERTCPICFSFNGRVYEILNIPEESQIPIHPQCRCAWSPVITE